ncbi:MAG TPA: hypothetical protein VM364_06115, partial [Vicinamibacterales bacterium]|nr:hypothetical protein [Vicinamibacterales bacterium]
PHDAASARVIRRPDGDHPGSEAIPASVAKPRLGGRDRLQRVFRNVTPEIARVTPRAGRIAPRAAHACGVGTPRTRSPTATASRRGGGHVRLAAQCGQPAAPGPPLRQRRRVSSKNCPQAVRAASEGFRHRRPDEL